MGLRPRWLRLWPRSWPRTGTLTTCGIALALASLLAVLAVVPPTHAVAAAPDVAVTIKNFSYNPGSLTVPVGTTVRWTNLDMTQHDVTGDSAAMGLRSPLLPPGQSFAFTFTQPGVYTYHCSPHPFMTGEIRVIAEESLDFPTTGFTVRGAFLTTWRSNGVDNGDPGISYRESLGLFGYPIGSVRREKLEDGNEYDVQYFERVRMEWHPEANQGAGGVLLGQFGRRILKADLGREIDPPAGALPGDGYDPVTQHNIDPRFLAYWQASGGLPQFGRPLTETLRQKLGDGREYDVQYFERARFEYHDEIADPQYRVLLGLFGNRILQGK